MKGRGEAPSARVLLINSVLEGEYLMLSEPLPGSPVENERWM